MNNNSTDPFEVGNTFFNNLDGLALDKFETLVEETNIRLWTQLRNSEYAAYYLFQKIVKDIDFYYPDVPMTTLKLVKSELSKILLDEERHVGLSDNIVSNLGLTSFNKSLIENRVNSYQLPKTLLTTLVWINLSEIGAASMLQYFYKHTKNLEKKEQLKEHLRDEVRHIKIQQVLCELMSKNICDNHLDEMKKLLLRPLFPWLNNFTFDIISSIKQNFNLSDVNVFFSLIDSKFFNEFFKSSIESKYKLFQILDKNTPFEQFERVCKMNIGTTIIENFNRV